MPSRWRTSTIGREFRSGRYASFNLDLSDSEEDNGGKRVAPAVSRFPEAPVQAGPRGPLRTSRTLQHTPKNKSPPACKTEGHVSSAPLPARAGVIGSSKYPGVLASASSYSPRLPGTSFQWLTSGFRPRSQLRGSDGISPSSPRHFVYCLMAILPSSCNRMLSEKSSFFRSKRHPFSYGQTHAARKSHQSFIPAFAGVTNFASRVFPGATEPLQPPDFARVREVRRFSHE